MNWLYSIFQWIYDLCFNMTGDFIISAVFMTMVLKVIQLPLDLRTNRTMLKQHRMKPLLDEINRKYEKDPERKNQKTMELYKKEKFNPLSGCLPLLLTWPLFIVVFGTLRNIQSEQAVVLYQTMACGIVPEIDAFLWIRNIWQADSFLNTPVIPHLAQIANLSVVNNNAWLTPQNVAAMRATYDTVMKPLVDSLTAYNNGWMILPLLCGGISLITVQINPMHRDQKKPQHGKPGGMNSALMKYMGPVISVLFCSSSSVVFSFYWLASNLWELGKQLLFNRRFKKMESECNEA